MPPPDFSKRTRAAHSTASQLDARLAQTIGYVSSSFIPSQPSGHSTALKHARTVAMDSVSSVALQALTDIAPLRIDTA